MNGQTADLFGHTAPQGDMSADHRPGPAERAYRPDADGVFRPNPEDVRRRLHKVLAALRASPQGSPWSERETRSRIIIFPNMSKWLPDDEAAQLKFEFTQELARLGIVT